MLFIRSLCIILLFSQISTLFAQNDSILYASYTTAANRAKLYKVISNSIGNLSKPLADSTEELYEDAFSSMELIYHRSPWADARIRYAFDSINNRTVHFQRSLLELAYSNYPLEFIKQVNGLARQTTNEKIFAMCAEYLLKKRNDSTNRSYLLRLVQAKFPDEQHPILTSLRWRLGNQSANSTFHDMFFKEYLPNAIVLFSFQRKNRDYPGLVIIRDTMGNFVRNADGTLFYVTQLARSLSNLPGYLTNGSTPQGLFRMDGFAKSKSTFIGPTTNIQLTMPGETSIRHFFNDSTIIDSIWTEALYSRLLPPAARSYFPLYGTYYAGMAGRTEIIAHGTTVDPNYYHSQLYFPYTPTEGCLCTKELWDPADGKRVESDQQKLVNAIKKVGGANGYCIVIELNDDQRPVSLEDVLSFTSLK